MMHKMRVERRKRQLDRIRTLHCADPSEYLRIRKVGDGTFGEVTLCKHVRSNELVALKKIRLTGANGEEGDAARPRAGPGNGLPITSLREIKVLQELRRAAGLQHPNVIALLDVVRHPGDAASGDPGSASLVFPFMDHDLKGLLDNPQVEFGLPRIKALVRQIAAGLAFLHACDVLHRDLKLANILVSNRGVAKLADFGLARPEFSLNGRLTSKVVTLWYRPPEALLGSDHYDGGADLWGLGCIVGELLTRRPLLPGGTEQRQLELICQLCGSPDYELQWPQFRRLPLAQVVKPTNPLLDDAYADALREHRKRKRDGDGEGKSVSDGEASDPEPGEVKPQGRPGADAAPFVFPPAGIPRASPTPLLERVVRRTLVQRATRDLTLDPVTLAFCSALLAWDPQRRPSALSVLQDEWFFRQPLPARADVDRFWGATAPASSHELMFRPTASGRTG